jgi:uncharacterized protein (DUF927 family)
MATGSASGVVVLDVDGQRGHSSLADLEHQGLTLPPTFTVSTGRPDGEHLYFCVSPDINIRNDQNSKIGPHIDVRGTGGCVVFPPSVHPNRKRYNIDDPDVPVADLPAWVVKKLTVRSPLPATWAQVNKQTLEKGERTKRLVSLAGTLRKSGTAPAAIEAALLAENAAKGNPPLPEEKVRYIAADIVERYPAGEPHAPTFQVTDQGVLLHPHSGAPPLWVSSRIDVVADTRDANGENWGRLLRWKDKEGTRHQWPMPLQLLATDAAPVRAHLMNGGLLIASERQARDAFTKYLLTKEVDHSIRCVERIGWHDGSYVLPGRVISPEDAEEIVFQTPHDTGHYWNVRGTAEEWKENIGRLCGRNSRLIFAVSCPFVGPLLSLVGAESGGVHFHGLSSTGKSTALIVGGSVCGGGGPAGFVQSWRATANGLEALAAAHNDATLFLDELSQVDPRNAAESAYQLGNGQGKGRMDRSTAARKRLVWRLLYVSAGELTLAEHAASAGQRTRGGAEVRLLNIDADAGAKMGMFEELHGSASAHEFADRLKAAAQRHYGAVLLKYINWLVRHGIRAKKFIRMVQNKFQDSVVPRNATGEVRRAAARLALIGAAGELATRLGLTGWRRNESIHAAMRVFREWLRNRGMTGPSDADAGIRAVRAFLLKHGTSRFESTRSSSRESIRDRAGFVRVEDGKPTEYYIFPEIFRNEVCNGHSFREVLKALEAQGFLRREPPNMTVKPNLPGVGRPRVYCVLSSILEGDET